MDSIPVDQMSCVPLEITLAEDLSLLKKMNEDPSVSFGAWRELNRKLEKSLKTFGLGITWFFDDEEAFYCVYALKDRE